MTIFVLRRLPAVKSIRIYCYVLQSAYYRLASLPNLLSHFLAFVLLGVINTYRLFFSLTQYVSIIYLTPIA